jgi:flagellar motor component MotA
MRSISLLIGLLLFLAAAFGMYVVYGGSPASIIAFPLSLLAVVIGTAGVSFCVFGVVETKVALWSVSVFWRKDEIERDYAIAIQVISGMIVYAYVIGALLLLQNLLLTMGTMSGVIQKGLTQELGGRVACAICTLIYSVLVAECFLRPLRHRLSYLRSRK